MKYLKHRICKVLAIFLGAVGFIFQYSVPSTFNERFEKYMSRRSKMDVKIRESKTHFFVTACKDGNAVSRQSFEKKKGYVNFFDSAVGYMDNLVNRFGNQMIDGNGI